MKKLIYIFIFTIIFTSIGLLVKAQLVNTNGFTFVKTIDSVDIYFNHVVCNDGEYLVIEAINRSTSFVSLNLQPILKSNNTTSKSTNPVIITINGNSKITGNCNISGFKVSIYEFFSIYDPTSITFDLTKI